MVTLNCSALGHPAPQFTWKPSGKEVLEHASNRLGLNLNQKTVFVVFFIGVFVCVQSVTVMGNKVISTVTLEASAVVLKDGVFCEAYNTHGKDSKNFKVSIKSGQCILLLQTEAMLGLEYYTLKMTGLKITPLATQCWVNIRQKTWG